ncbi:hypothetical protein [Novosphingobium sp. PY1]|uniref:hypothetical protein n=1 Tax=Novosphingobium sp. PY1 TaxID=1882221 RepID=UPI001A8C724D|nr:hypothetical protein [Novosphingobium sp. PY1]
MMRTDIPIDYCSFERTAPDRACKIRVGFLGSAWRKAIVAPPGQRQAVAPAVCALALIYQ